MKPRPKGDRIHSRGLDRSFSESELQQFFSVIDKRKDLVAFLTQLGLSIRIEELIRLKIDDINFQRDEVRIQNIKTKECVWCKHLNPVGFTYCAICKRPLKADQGLMVFEAMSNIDEKLRKAASNHQDEFSSIMDQMAKLMRKVTESDTTD